MSLFWVFSVFGLLGFASLVVMFRAMSFWAEVVRAIDAMSDAQRAAIRWPDVPGRAVLNKRLQNRVIFFGPPPNVSADAVAAASRYRLWMRWLYAVWFAVIAVMFGWPAVGFALLLGLVAVIAGPWPRVMHTETTS